MTTQMSNVSCVFDTKKTRLKCNHRKWAPSALFVKCLSNCFHSIPSNRQTKKNRPFSQSTRKMASAAMVFRCNRISVGNVLLLYAWKILAMPLGTIKANEFNWARFKPSNPISTPKMCVQPLSFDTVGF